MSRRVLLQRLCSQRTSQEVHDKQIKYMLRRGLAGSRGRGWKVKELPYSGDPVRDKQSGLWRFDRGFIFTREGGRAGTEESTFQEILKYIAKAGCSQGGLAKYPWLITEPAVADDRTIAIKTRRAPQKEMAKIGTEMGTLFDHIYEREPHIKVIYSAVMEFIESEYRNRFHIVLHGPPACGKSELMLGFGKMFGAENEAYLKLDATSTTQAGAQKLLLDNPYTPPIALIEELEKADEKTLRWILGITDVRGEIRKTNFHDNRYEERKMLVIATVNNMNTFNNMLYGALASRFPNKLFCPRPNEKVLRQILLREINLRKGNPEWVTPTLDFCHKILEIDDPRSIIPICLMGKDDLLDGSYQKDILQTMSGELQEKFKTNIEKFAKEGMVYTGGLLQPKD